MIDNMFNQNLFNQLLHQSEIDIQDYKRELPDTSDISKLAELVRDIISIANSAYAKNVVV